MEDKQKKIVKRKTSLRLGLEAIVISAATAGLYQLPSEAVENFYSNGVFKSIARIEGFIGDALPFSIWEGILVGTTASAAYLLEKSTVIGAKNFQNIFSHQKKEHSNKEKESRENARNKADSKLYGAINTLKTFSF